MIGPFSIDMYLPALPALGASLNASPGAVQGTLAIYFLGLACGQMMYGPMSDRFGRRGPLFVGLSLYTVAATACALAPDVQTLTVARLFQALGGCSGMVIARAMVRDVSDERGSVRLMAQLMLVMGVAPVIAPIVGGAVLPVFGWRGIFALLAVYGVTMLAVIALFLPESLPIERRRRDGFAAVLRVWVGLLMDRRFLGLALAGGFISGGMFTYISGSPFVFMELNGVPPGHYGFYFGANALGIMAMGQIVGRLAHRIPPKRILPVTITVPFVSGLVLLLVTKTGFGGFPAMLVALFFFVAMMGGVMPLTTALAMGPHGAVAGSASALMGTLQFSIGALSGTVLGALQDGTAVPMAMVIAGCGVAGWCSRRFLAR
ncbi:multidrug effflux MFS transporter [Roseomonas sp. HJA6]|uniref:Bcr/CflA family efflux transporter n=2 Tax=Roseomonas alba TaxID=2846776 RepID=A0ABS7AG32_9PROT|nr:multidrug effflux MFS transporter [Neoroseomonas alba]